MKTVNSVRCHWGKKYFIIVKKINLLYFENAIFQKGTYIGESNPLKHFILHSKKKPKKTQNFFSQNSSINILYIWRTWSTTLQTKSVQVSDWEKLGWRKPWATKSHLITFISVKCQTKSKKVCKCHCNRLSFLIGCHALERSVLSTMSLFFVNLHVATDRRREPTTCRVRDTNMDKLSTCIQLAVLKWVLAPVVLMHNKEFCF